MFSYYDKDYKLLGRTKRLNMKYVKTLIKSFGEVNIRYWEI